MDPRAAASAGGKRPRLPGPVGKPREGTAFRAAVMPTCGDASIDRHTRPGLVVCALGSASMGFAHSQQYHIACRGSSYRSKVEKKTKKNPLHTQVKSKAFGKTRLPALLPRLQTSLQWSSKGEQGLTYLHVAVPVAMGCALRYAVLAATKT